MEIVSYVPFEDNKEYRAFMAKRFSGVGPLYIQVADDMNDPNSVMKATPVLLTYKSCRVITNNSGSTSMVFNRHDWKMLMDWTRLHIIKENKKQLLSCIDKVKHVLGDAPIVTELENKITALAKSVEDLYNKD